MCVFMAEDESFLYVDFDWFVCSSKKTLVEQKITLSQSSESTSDDHEQQFGAPPATPRLAPTTSVSCFPRPRMAVRFSVIGEDSTN